MTNHRNCKIVFERIYMAETDTGELWIGRIKDGLTDGDGRIFDKKFVEACLLKMYRESDLDS